MGSFIDKLLKNFDSPDAIKFSEKKIYKKDDAWLPTGIPEMEDNLGILGYPVGLTEISGMSKSGKTTLALMAMREFQKKYPNGVCIILSSENRDNKEYAEQMSINTEEVIIIKTRIVEDMFYQYQRCIDEIAELWEKEGYEGKPKIFTYWDSLGATLSKAEADAFRKNMAIMEKNEEGEGKETKYKNPQLGSFAKNAKLAMKSILSQLYEKDIFFIILNHRYDKISGQPGTKSGGGHWVEFLPSLRLETIRTQWIKLDEEEVAQLTKVKVEKNDYGSRKETVVEILLGYGVVLSEADLKYAAEHKLVKKEGVTKFNFLNMKWSSRRTYYEQYKQRNKLIPILIRKISNLRHIDILKDKGIE